MPNPSGFAFYALFAIVFLVVFAIYRTIKRRETTRGEQDSIEAIVFGLIVLVFIVIVLIWS